MGSETAKTWSLTTQNQEAPVLGLWDPSHVFLPQQEKELTLLQNFVNQSYLRLTV